jgi:hypothetical protein
MLLYLTHDQERKILYELVKYSYHQIDNEQLKNVIYDFMVDHRKISFLLDVVHNFHSIPYSTLLHKGYEYERFFSTDSLIFVYGDNLPKRIKDRTFFPEYFTDDKILLDSTDKAYEYFKVIFHKNLREIRDTKENNNWDFSRNSSCDTLYNLLDFIAQNSKCVFVSNNISWVTKILRKEQYNSNDFYQPQTTSLCMLIAVNSIFIFIAMTMI